MGPAVHPVHVRPPVRCCRSPHRCMLVLVVWEFSMSCLNSARAWQVSLSYSSITRRACVTLNQLQTKCLHHVIFFSGKALGRQELQSVRKVMSAWRYILFF